MRHFPNFLVVGATHKHAGKTTFLCRLLSSFTVDSAPVAVKITTIDAMNEGYHPDVTTPYSLRRETVPMGEKDSQRLLRDGARRVYWLRVHREAFEAGFQELLALLPSHHPVLFESNSVPQYVRPGAFLVLHSEASGNLRPNSQSLLQAADYIVEAKADHFSMAPESLSFDHDHWRLPQAARPWKVQ